MKRTTLALAATALLFSSFAFADDHEEEKPPALTDVWMIAAKPGMYSELRDGFKAYFALRKEAGETRDWTIYSPVVSESMNRLMIRHCCFDWADQDAYEAMVSENMSDLTDEFDELVAPYMDHLHRYMERTDWEHSHIVDGGFEGPYYGETTWYLSEGFHPEAGEARRAVSKALKDGWANDDNQWLWLNRIGGKPAISIVSSYENWADMAEPEETVWDFMMKKVGEEKMKDMFKNFSHGKKSSSYTIWKRDDDASMNLDDE